VIILTSYADDEAVLAAILAGCASFVLKQTRGNVLADAIAAVASGESLLDSTITQKDWSAIRDGMRDNKSDPLNVLNEQERRILAFIAGGNTKPGGRC